jgi:cold shock protein
MARPRSDSPTRYSGTIVRLVPDRGFGFLKGPDGVDHFFHRSAAQAFDALSPGTAVTFVAGQGEKGPRAEAVELA